MPPLQHTGPHGVDPLGQQKPSKGDEQVPVQHVVPHDVCPEGHPHVDVAALLQATPAGQHAVPHTVVPDGQAASARKGLTTKAAVPATAIPAKAFNRPRREVVIASVFDTLSKPLVMPGPRVPPKFGPDPSLRQQRRQSARWPMPPPWLAPRRAWSVRESGDGCREHRRLRLTYPRRWCDASHAHRLVARQRIGAADTERMTGPL